MPKCPLKTSKEWKDIVKDIKERFKVDDKKADDLASFAFHTNGDMPTPKRAIEILEADRDVLSLRLMPCPGSSGKEGYWGKWKKLMPNDMIFSYQATIWRRQVYIDYMSGLIQQRAQLHPDLERSKYNWYAININPAETFPGLQLLKLLYPTGIHLCWPCVGAWANAVYQSPWPYRPTAVVNGRLEDWAVELAQREGFYLSGGPSER